MSKVKHTETRALIEFEIIESKAYIVHAYDKDDALKRFGNYDIVQEGDYWPDVRELGPTPYVEEIEYY